MRVSVHGDVEAPLVYLVLYQAAAVGAHVVEHLAENPFQRVVAHAAACRSVGVVHGLVAVVAYVECGAVEVATVLCGVAVVSAQLVHVLLAAQHARHYDFVQWYAFHLQAVEEAAPYVLKQHRGTRHEVGNAVAQLVYMEVHVAAHVDEFFHAVLRIGAVGYGFHTVFLCGRELHVVLVGKRVAEVWHAVYAVLGRRAVGVEETCGGELAAVSCRQLGHVGRVVVPWRVGAGGVGYYGRSVGGCGTACGGRAAAFGY